MTDELTPEQEEAVRSLLSDARHDEPVPADVAARLDRVLDELGSDRDPRFAQDDAEVGTVTDLSAARHRRRKAGRLVLAAAAIVVGGVAIGQVLNDGGLSSDDADSSAESSAQDVPRSTAAGDAGAGQPAQQDAGGEAAAPSAASAPADSLLDQVRAPLQLTSSDFAADVERELGRSTKARQKAANEDFDGVAAYATASGGFVCADADYGEGSRLPAYYDAEEAVLVLRRPRAGVQTADLLACGTAAPLNSVDLPAE